MDFTFQCFYKPFNQYWPTIIMDHVYFKTRAPTQVNTNQHESTRVNTSPTRIYTSQTRVNMNQYQSDTSQHESTRVQHGLIRPRNYHSLS